MTAPSGNSVVFLRIPMFHSTSYRDTLRLTGKQNHRRTGRIQPPPPPSPQKLTRSGNSPENVSIVRAKHKLHQSCQKNKL